MAGSKSIVLPDYNLMEEFINQFPSDIPFGANSPYDHLARIVAEDIFSPEKWRCYFLQDWETIATLSALTLEEAIAIREADGDHDHTDELRTITVFGFRGDTVAFRDTICPMAFGYLMSRFAPKNSTAFYGSFSEMAGKDWVNHRIKGFLAAFKRGPSRGRVLDTETGTNTII